MTDSGNNSLPSLEGEMGYSFKNRTLLEQAVTHPSFRPAEGSVAHNQRLEFLGDAVLGLVLAESLYEELPNEREGTLTRFRSMLVKGNQLHHLAQKLSLGTYLRMGEGEEAMGGRERPSILEDAFEAVIGAVYEDGGIEAAKAVARKVYGPLGPLLDRLMDEHNPKGRLQEIFQPTHGNDSIEYRLSGQSGPDHAKQFEIEVWIDGTCRGKGKGHSKQRAEEAAALEALESVPDQPGNS